MRQTTSASNPIVSVVIPAYNAQATIADTIRSVRAQTEKNWELIIVDDGSTDATLSMVGRFSRSDQRIQLVSQKNKGPSAARNNGVSLARADAIAFLDADDTWEPNHLSLALDMLSENERLGVAFAPCDIVDEHGRSTGQRTRPSTSNIDTAQILAGNPTATCSSLIVRRSVFRDAGLMREDMVHAEDQEWLFRVVLSGWQCRSHSTYSVNYRCSPTGLSSDVGRMFDGWKMFIDLAKRNAPQETIEHLSSATASMHFYYAKRLLSDGKFSSALVHHLGTAWMACPLTASTMSARLVVSLTARACRRVFAKSGFAQLSTA